MNPARPFSPFFRSCIAMALVATCAFALPSNASSQVRNTIDGTSRAKIGPVDRVRGAVTGERTALKGQTRPLAREAVDLGEAPASLASGRMVIWLRRSVEQQAQLSQFLSQTQKAGSANYRHWMTPATFGAAYGVSDHDLAAVQSWLQSSGLKVEGVAAARNAVMFSGTVGSVAGAFHTSIHRYTVGQQTHFANAADPEVPTALAPVIAGVSPMNDFHAEPLLVHGKPARYDAASHRLKPAITGDNPDGSFDLFVTPADASIIYDTPNQNFNPAATQTLDGTGITIGILGYSALAMADVQNYRTAFLPAAAASNLPTQILDGAIDPGIIPGGAADEALLDVEIAGGLAPGAAINYYYAASTDLSDGLILAGLHALEENKVNILSVSYGNCEAGLGLGGNLEWSELWQQAAAQGITVTVSTGDTGSAGCNLQSDTQATNGLAVSGLASTPFNIAVGGTDFYSLANNLSTYVNTTTTGAYPYYATALSYIPENPWNDSSQVIGNSFTDNTPAYNGIGETDIIAGAGGLSSAATCQGYIQQDGTCSQSLSGYPQPAFQTGFQSINPVRSLPDVSLLSANGFFGAAWVFCSDSVTDAGGGVYTDCQLDANGHLINDQYVGTVGGTSAAAPAFAGMLAMISQSQGGARLGQADAVLYNLAQDYNPNPSSPGKYQRAFHDVTIGNNSVYCASGTLNCGSNNFLEGYNATPSYDMATGLGSVDLSQLVSLWGTTNFASTSNVLTAGTSSDSLSTAAITIPHGTPLYFETNVTPSDATGQFSIIASNTTKPASYSDFAPVTGTGDLTKNDLPGGTYTVSAYYAGDTSHIASQSSNSISLTVSPEASTTSLFFGDYDPTTFVIKDGLSTVPYGVNSYVTAQPFGNSSVVDYTGNLLADGLPTGSVTFTSSGQTQTTPINSLGYAQISISSLAPGTYTYQASYPGDASFQSSTSSTQSLTVTKGLTLFSLPQGGGAVTPVNVFQFNALLQTDSVALYPTGGITATANGHTYAPLGSVQGQLNGVDATELTFSIPASDLATGSNVISISYSGDGNYQSATATTNVTLVGSSGSYSLSGPTQPLVAEAGQQTSTTISITPSNGFTGLVSMACTVSAAATGHTPTCVAASSTVYGSFGATSAVAINTFADTPAANYTITVTGTNGTQSQSAQVPMQVTAGPGFTLAAASNSLSISAAGQMASDVLTLSPTQGFTGNLALSCVIAPMPSTGKPATCSLPGNVALSSSTPATATLQVATDSTTPAGAYTVTVTALSGLLQQSVSASFTLPQLAATPAFDLSAASSALSIAAAGESVADTLTIRPAGGFTGTVQLSCTVVASATATTAAPTCTVPSTASVTGGSVVTAILTVNTTSSSAKLAPAEGGMLAKRTGGIALGCVLMFMIPRRRKWMVLGLFILTLGSLGITGCAGGGSQSGTTTTTGGSPGTPAGGYTVTVTATSGSITNTAQVQVTVQ
ncbi:hypothetical protein HDF16_002758 [Granulicella aggregans]|uniref:Peptidase S53 domain-containing protein n=1 Tax=Granulicella aggregans TaxID=474949 RepID=A0A7W8E3Y1_9BACT|nr:protease pro-enzyme activation domain-containing protein [Granulicella aggregans]MBB5058052.1 hypothetical protein [Granulicella aggregans]